jgi:hypothetical protein
VSEPAVFYEPRPGTTPESELSTLASVYKFVFDCHAKKRPTPESRPDDAKERSQDDSSARTIIPDR